MADLGDLFGVSFKRPVPVTPRTGGARTPPVLGASFTAEAVKLLYAWWRGAVKRNILVTGPTGSGKSFLVEQFCARMGVELFRVPCHGRMTFPDLVGLFTLKGGETVWVDGPLTLAMRCGGVLLLDEINFLPPQLVGGVNTVLDGRPLEILETGEVVTPHPDFRVAATGNAVDDGDDAAAYRGVETMNVALLRRFMVMQHGYMSLLEEIKVVHEAAPGVDGDILQVMLEIAKSIRDAHAGGSMAAPMSTDGLVSWARLIQTMGAGGRQKEVMADCLGYAFANALPPAERQSVITLLSRVIPEDGR